MISAIRHGGHYAELYQTYFRHQELSYIPRGMNLQAGRLAEAGE